MSLVDSRIFITGALCCCWIKSARLNSFENDCGTIYNSWTRVRDNLWRRSGCCRRWWRTFERIRQTGY